MQINEILVHCTGQTLERIQWDTERDFFMSADAAKDYGLIDEIIAPSTLNQTAELAAKS